MIPTKPVDIALDSLLRISGTAFAFSFFSHLLRLPHFAFAAGAIFAVLGLALGFLGNRYPQLRALIAYRIIQTIAGVALGVL
ncbi:hypothetical protein [Microcoleus sp. FACHB-672]|uniref:hypothetical protein n=1 Tax=Microcoleus sp. FACHB-672 TaxID=2692825 RepID=UPI0016863742|nr:hypothetical protein [Microcoleus sp. FACHB-672]MBD2040184.1 hypothetical protein [Microcoleus sp. FACHB-672]